MIQSYIRAEKQESYFFLTAGIVACTVGGWFLLSAWPPFYTGLSIPLILVGIIQVTVGATVARRSDRQAEDLEALLAEGPAEFRRQEAPRMAAVMRNFVIYRWVEIGFVVVGLVLAFLNHEMNFAKGLGWGMFGQGALMLLLDFFAEKRGRAYARFVNA